MIEQLDSLAIWLLSCLLTYSIGLACGYMLGRVKKEEPKT